MRPFLRRVLTSLCGVLLFAASGAAQNPGGLPGGRGVDTDVQRAQFTGVVMGIVRTQIGEWMDVWQTDSPDELTRRYTGTATLLLPAGKPVQGTEEIAAFAEHAVPAVGDAGLTITDFDASEGIAYMYGAYSFVPRRAGEQPGSGHHVTLMQRDGRTWRMRAQLYRPDATGSSFPSNGGAVATAARPPAAATATPLQHEAMVTLAALRTAWSKGDVNAAAALFSHDALLQLPGSEQAARGERLVTELAEAMGSFRAFHTALLDFGQAERISFLLGRYYLEARSGRPVDGNFIIVLAGHPGRRKIRSLVFTPAPPAVAPAPAPAQTPAATAPAPTAPITSDTSPAAARLGSAQEARIDALFADFNGDATPGCALAVVQRGQVVLQRGYGLANLADNVRITPQSAFYAASVSKQFTAFAVALLADQQKLSLDDDVRRYIPEVPDFGSTITIRHLLHHTSGLRDYLGLLGLTGWPSDGPFTEAEFLQLVGRQRALNFEPGEQYLYSNTGYVLLAVLVQRITGQSLRDFAAAELFRPLGMINTQFRDDHRLRIANHALAYVPMPDGGWRMLVPGFDVVGDGGLYTTVEDLARWERNYDELTVGGQAVAALMHTRGRLNSGAEIAYALGLTMGEYRGARMVQHGGTYAGYRAHFARFPDEQAAVTLLCNASTANPSQLALRIADIVLGDRLAPAAEGAAQATTAQQPTPAPSGIVLDAAQLVAYTGSYYSEELDATWRFDARDGALVLNRPLTPFQPLTAVEPDVFAFGQTRLRFQRDSAGRVTHLLLDAGRVRGIRFDAR